MELFSWSNWPLFFVSAAMVVAAVIDGWKLKVPNWLTFPLIVSGLLFGLCHDLGWLPGTGSGPGRQGKPSPERGGGQKGRAKNPRRATGW